MKLIFLDFDGVLNSERYYDSEDFANKRKNLSDAELMLTNHHLHIDPVSIEVLNRIVKDSGAKVIASTTWRFKFSPEELTEFCKTNGGTFIIEGATPRIYPPKMSMFVSRGEEIKAYLLDMDEVEESFLVIDDINTHPFEKNTVQTNYSDGLIDIHYDMAMKILK